MNARPHILLAKYLQSFQFWKLRPPFAPNLISPLFQLYGFKRDGNLRVHVEVSIWFIQSLPKPTRKTHHSGDTATMGPSSPARSPTFLDPAPPCPTSCHDPLQESICYNLVNVIETKIIKSLQCTVLRRLWDNHRHRRPTKTENSFCLVIRKQYRRGSRSDIACGEDG